MFKSNYDFHETIRRTRRIFDGKVTYRKLFVVIIICCLFFLWILTRLFGSDKVAAKGNRVTSANR